MQKQAFLQKFDIAFESMEPTGTKPLRFDSESVALPRDTVPFLHYHSRIEVGICTSGLGIFYGNDFAESVKSGDIIFFLPGHAHYSRSVDENLCMCRFAYLEPNALLSDLLGENNRVLNILKDSLLYDLPAVIRKSEHPHTYGILYALLDVLFSQRTQNPELMCALRLSELLLTVPESFEKTKKEAYFLPPDNPISLVESFISSHYYENITADKLSSICFLSESQLRRRFKAIYGTSPMQYLKKLRCTIGAGLLLQTDLSVAEISARVGYTDVSVFYRHFVAIYGISPTEYRK